MAHLDGVYRIYLDVNGTSSALTLDMPPSGDISYIIGAPDDQDPWRNAYQQVLFDTGHSHCLQLNLEFL